MNYYIEKSIEHRRADARRVQRDMDFVREVRAAGQRERAARRRALGPFANWAPVRMRRAARDGGAT